MHSNKIKKRCINSSLCWQRALIDRRYSQMCIIYQPSRLCLCILWNWNKVLVYKAVRQSDTARGHWLANVYHFETCRLRASIWPNATTCLLYVSLLFFAILLCNNQCDQTRIIQVVPKEKLIRNPLSVALPIKSKVMHPSSFGITYYSCAIALSHAMDTWDPKKNTILVITKARDNRLVAFTRQLAEWLIFTPQFGKKNPFVV